MPSLSKNSQRLSRSLRSMVLWPTESSRIQMQPRMNQTAMQLRNSLFSDLGAISVQPKSRAWLVCKRAAQVMIAADPPIRLPCR